MIESLDLFDFTGKRLINKKAKFIKCDIKDKTKLAKIINDYEINSIIHLAAYLNIREAEKNKKNYYFRCKRIYILVNACKNSNVRIIIFSSSCSIYGDCKGSVSEKKNPNPQGYYAYTKYKGRRNNKKIF